MFGRPLLALAILLSGPAACREEQHDVRYYCKNKAPREAELARCRNDPGKLRHTPNCMNAEEAQRQIGLTEAMRLTGQTTPGEDPCP